ncbi:D-threo-aldose 1-dehydrogenase [Microlunatus sagamiharensis]|uniref:D-threo-aldose 1-dehydrogenase n=1 Tax=Microlunatus sagamiharensis TaxID=546874 RepID=A0A1H2MJ13_9ACTN|nr:aldo/keto reductase [Microlunatus sagamiharensis]SDU93179.1 D-threo-aldose 1-dehydrogenase [Microlunatus sagamiharensis]
MTTPSSPDWVRPLGATGLQVTALSVGGGPLGSIPKQAGREDAQDDGVALAAHVLDSPCRVLDTSNGYSDGESERRIGGAIALRGGLPEDFLVMTKVDARGRDYSGDRVRASVAESKERLGLDTLPMVFLHDPEYFDFEQMSAPGGAVDTLVRLREEGEIGHLGLAGGPAPEMQRYLALGPFEVLLVHNRWTLVDRSATALLEQAEQAGIPLVNAAVHGGGILGKPGTTTQYAYREADPAVLAAVDAMARLCEEHGTTLATAALQASVRDPRVTTTLVGLSSPARLDSLLASLEEDLPDELFTGLEGLRPAPEHWLEPPRA